MKHIAFYTSLIALFVSCTSNDDSSSQLQQPESNFYALTVGNSWVYKWYEMDERNQDPNIYTGITESITIEDTEIIDGETFYKLKKVVTGNPSNNQGIPTIPNILGDGEYYEFYRDSLGFLIDNTGLIKFSNNTNEEILIFTEFDGYMEIFLQLFEETVSKSTEAGTFNCLESSKSLHEDGVLTIQGFQFYYYADGYGLISDKKRRIPNCDFCGFFEKRLDSYVVQ